VSSTLREVDHHPMFRRLSYLLTVLIAEFALSIEIISNERASSPPAAHREFV
jgi:hypothetical protein